jgi:hypothetical protein
VKEAKEKIDREKKETKRNKEGEMYADAGWEFRVSPGFFPNYMATTNVRTFGHCDQYQLQVPVADAGLISSSSGLTDVGSHVVTFLVSLLATFA